jgi:RimJ/RimL family protein N-acetyltransferase
VRSGPGRGKRLGVQLVARPFASLEAADCGDDAGTTDVERRRRRLQFGAGCHRVVDEQDPPISRVLALPFVGNGPPHLVLREVEDRDLDVLFEHWPDREAIRMAAFTSPDPDDRGAFDARWARLRRDQNTTNKVVETEGRVVGHIASFDLDGQREVTYWIGRQDWGRGIATRALQQFLTTIEVARPLYARAASDNAGSIRVLEKCGFTHVGDGRGFAHGRDEETEEVVLRLDA